MADKPALLVVDDEPMITTILAEILHRAGYPVLPANGAQDALDLCRDASLPIALAIIDYLMPEKNGLELAIGLKELLPGMRIVMMSGYAGAEMLRSHPRCEIHGFLQKPFNAQAAVQMVRNVLEWPNVPKGQERKAEEFVVL